MEIKVLQNLNEATGEPINENYILINEKIDDKKVCTLSYSSLFLVDINTNEKTPIAENIDKLYLNNIFYASLDRDYIVFLGVKEKEESLELTYYYYDIEEKEVRKIISFEESKEDCINNKQKQVFVLDKYNVLIQEEVKEENNYKLELINLQREVKILITIPFLVKNGIEKLIALPNNKCLLKIGKPFIAEPINQNVEVKQSNECIGTVIINKFISELFINMDNQMITILEQAKENTTIPYVRFNGNQVIYAIYYPSEDREEIVLYDVENDKKTIRINTKTSNFDALMHSFVVNSNPYLISKSSSRHINIIDLNTQKPVIKLLAGDEVLFAIDDVVAIQTTKKKVFSQPTPHIDIYRFPNIYEELVTTIKGEYLSSFISGNNLMVLTK